MKDLIEALIILLKYGDPHYSTHCEHDEMWVMIDPAEVSKEDLARLDELGFKPWQGESFHSYRFGSV